MSKRKEREKERDTLIAYKRRNDETEYQRGKFICIGPLSLFRAEIQLIGFPSISVYVCM